MTPLGAALRKKFRTPQEAMEALGLDAALLVSPHVQEHMMASRKAILLQGALTAAILPKLAQDAALPDLSKVLASVTPQNFRANKPRIAQDIRFVMRGKLAQDADLDDLPKLLDAFEKIDGIKGEDADVTPRSAGNTNAGAGAGGSSGRSGTGYVDVGGAGSGSTTAAEMAGSMPSQDSEADSPIEQIKALLAGKIDDKTMAQLSELVAHIGQAGAQHEEDEIAAAPEDDTEAVDPAAAAGESDKPFEDGAEDEDTDDEAKRKAEAEAKAKEKDKQAMDKKLKIAVDSAVSTAVAKERKNAREIRMAFDAVRPLVGDLSIDADSPADVYKAVLEMSDIATDGVHPSAFQRMVEMLPRQRQGGQRPAIAQDKAAADLEREMFPNSGRLIA